MPAGSIKTVLVCQVGGAADPHVACPPGTGAVATQIYVIDPASASFFDSIIVPFDPAQAATFFFAAFCITLFVAWFAWQSGEIMDMVKRILGIKY